MSIIQLANFREDVANPKNIEAENIVFRYLQYQMDRAIDRRGRNIAWDFEFTHGGKRFRLDVKHDQHIESSRNVPFEVCDLIPDGNSLTIRPTWGVNEDLDYLAVVNDSMSIAYVVNMKAMRRVVTAAYRPGHPRWAIPNGRNGRTSYITFGIAIPIDTLESHGVKVRRVDLRPYRRTA